MFTSLKRVLKAHGGRARDSVSSRKRILGVLRQLKADHELLSVSVTGCQMAANSAILSISESRDSFLLDELSRPQAHRAFLEYRKAVIHSHLQGMEVQFATHLLKAGSEAGIALYEVTVPEQMHNVQRRDHFRLRLIPNVAVPVTAPHFEGQAVNGEAFDLSAGGIGTFLRTRNLPSRGQILSDLSISLPGSPPLEASIEVRFARLDSARHMLRLGGRFVDLGRTQERRLAQFLAEQQRKRRRFEPR